MNPCYHFVKTGLFWINRALYVLLGFSSANSKPPVGCGFHFYFGAGYIHFINRPTSPWLGPPTADILVLLLLLAAFVMYEKRYLNKVWLIERLIEKVPLLKSARVARLSPLNDPEGHGRMSFGQMRQKLSFLVQTPLVARGGKRRLSFWVLFSKGERTTVLY